MKLADLPSRIVRPLGGWPEPKKPMTAEERRERRRKSWRDYAERQREQRGAA